MKKILYIPFLMLILSGCEYHFDLDLKDQEDKLQLICTVNPDRHALIQVNRVVPFNKYEQSGLSPMELKLLDISINGRAAECDRIEVDGCEYLRTKESLSEGDEISVRAKGSTTSEVHASAIVPKPVSIVQIDTLSLYFVSIDQIVSNFYIDIELEQWSADSFYALNITDIEHITYYDETGSIIEENENIVSFPVSKNSVTSYPRCPYSGATFPIDGHPYSTVLISGKDLEDGHIKLETTYAKSESYNGVVIENTYHLELFSVSPSFYYYGRAIYMNDNNTLAEFGFSAPNFSYSNISGGFGVVAATSTATVLDIPIPLK